MGIEMHAAMGELAAAGPERFSRTLLRSATNGVPGRYLASGGMVAESLERLPVQAAACAPLMTRDSAAACLYVDGTDATIPDEQLRGDMDFVIALAQLASVAMSNLARSDLERRFSEARNKLFEGTVRAMAAAIDAKDPYTRGHSDRVSWLSGELASAVTAPRASKWPGSVDGSRCGEDRCPRSRPVETGSTRRRGIRSHQAASRHRLRYSQGHSRNG